MTSAPARHDVTWARMNRRVVVSLAFLPFWGCAATRATGPVETPKESATTEAAPYAEELQRAERLRAEAEAIEPPVVGGALDQAASLAFIREQLRPWIERRRGATARAVTARAVAAYAALRPKLPDPEGAKAALASGAVQLSCVADFERTSELVVPTNIRDDPELLKAYRGAIRDAIQPERSKARAAFEECVALADRANVASTAAQCRARVRELLPTGPEEPAKMAAQRATRPTVQEQSRPFLATQQAKPCVFSGTLQLWRAPLALPGGAEIARFEQLEVEQLQLPAQADAALRITTAWPVRGMFTLSPNALPFDLRARVELVQGHVWLAAGAAVSAVSAKGDLASVFRPQPAEEGLRSSPAPQQVVPCSALQLAGTRPTSSGALTGETLTVKGNVSLSAVPKGPPIAVLRLRDAFVAQVRERRAGWARISADSTTVRGFGEIVPFDFDGWTNAPASDETPFGMLAVFTPRSAPTHVTTAELDLLEKPAAPAFAKVVSGVAILTGETRDGFVEVSVPGVGPSDTKQWGFWIAQKAFTAGTRGL
jgi:hypothetical protein